MPASVTPQQSKVIDWLRFPLAAAVVLSHAGKTTTGFYDPDFCSSIRIFLSQGICRIAPPCFFFISGFLFFSRMQEWDKELWFNKIKKRSRTLLLPYILWNILCLLICNAYDWIRAFVNPSVVPVSLLEALRQNGWLNIFWACTFGCPIDYPLWFIRDLILFVAITPLVFFFVKKCRFWGVIVMFVAGLLIRSRDYEGLFFFVVGACYRLSPRDFLLDCSRIKWLAYILTTFLALSIVFTFRSHIDFYEYLKYLLVFFGTVSCINFSSFVTERNLIPENEFLTSSGFFVYASHAILILHDFAHYITLHLLPFTSVAGQCLALFAKWVIAVGICLGLYALMKKWTPKTLGVLTGNRA